MNIWDWLPIKRSHETTTDRGSIIRPLLAFDAIAAAVSTGSAFASHPFVAIVGVCLFGLGGVATLIAYGYFAKANPRMLLSEKTQTKMQALDIIDRKSKGIPVRELDVPDIVHDRLERRALTDALGFDDTIRTQE